MTKKKPLPTKSAQERPAVKVHTAILRNQAMHTEAPEAAVPDAAILRITGLLAQLSPANRHLAENLIRAIVDEQARET